MIRCQIDKSMFNSIFVKEYYRTDRSGSGKCDSNFNLADVIRIFQEKCFLAVNNYTKYNSTADNGHMFQY
eukprot:snap_masked-scaffold_35-processed-gene-2.60-mRNA-1 protein AED:1.00 eAED:1.00 QI:0/0/0/0/1/1/2/0/69